MKFELKPFQSDNSFQPIRIIDGEGNEISPENFRILMTHWKMELLTEQNQHLKAIGEQLTEMNFHFREEEKDISKSIRHD